MNPRILDWLACPIDRTSLRAEGEVGTATTAPAALVGRTDDDDEAAPAAG